MLKNVIQTLQLQKSLNNSLTKVRQVVTELENVIVKVRLNDADRFGFCVFV